MDQDTGRLTKKERKLLGKQEREEQFAREKTMKLIRNCFIVSLLALLIMGGGWWIVKESSKPLPGESVEDQGKKHVSHEEWEKFTYNSNPPTSGPHDAEWIRAGVYDSPQGEGNLVHSLEHGYIIISYNCKKVSEGKACDDLKKQLKEVAEGQKLSKLIVVARPQLDVPIALTAWTRIVKMDKVDRDLIRRFIESYRDHGPEQTME